MKRIAWLVLLAGCLFLMGAGGVVQAYSFPGTEVEHWEWDNTVPGWVYHATNESHSLARCFKADLGKGACNQKVWPISVEINASVAQWIDWVVDGTKWYWFVMKPGLYVADSIGYTIKSNQEVEITFEGFDNLKSDKSDTDIAVFYAESLSSGNLPGPKSVLWIPATLLNGQKAKIPDSTKLHTDGSTGKLWCMIHVVACNSACEYKNTATIKVDLVCQKTWVDFTTGGWG